MSKGSRNERRLVSILQEAGMATYRPATVRYGENDMFGLFDVLALSPSHEEVYAIQVKSNKAAGIRSWQRHTQLFRSLGWRTQYAVPIDNLGWRLIEVTQEGHTDVIDERNTDGKVGEDILAYYQKQGE